MLSAFILEEDTTPGAKLVMEFSLYGHLKCQLPSIFEDLE